MFAKNLNETNLVIETTKIMHLLSASYQEKVYEFTKLQLEQQNDITYTSDAMKPGLVKEASVAYTVEPIKENAQNLKSKFNMTRDQSIFVAKRNIVDYIFKSAKLEGFGVTYPATDAIFNGVGSNDATVKETIAINNLKRAWQFLLDTLDIPIDYTFICHLNKLVGRDDLIFNSGKIRTLDVTIGGTTWRPEIPNEEKLKAGLAHLSLIENHTERAMEIMLYLMRGQFFMDGNKRTATFAANKEMIANGQGVISIPLDQIEPFKHQLIHFYETNQKDDIKEFIYLNCIDGIDFQN